MVRKYLLSWIIPVCVVGLLLTALTADSRRRVEVPDRPGRDQAAVDRLLRLMAQRLMLMHDVARWKWNAHRPITDLQRERELLQSVVERGRDKGLDPGLVRPFFEAQLAAARLVQQADIERWEASKQQPFASTTSLEVLRQQIDELNRELLDALTEVSPRLAEPAVQQALSRRSEEIFVGDGLDKVRATAIDPLLPGR